MRLLTEADERFQLTQRERITFGALAQSEGMTARELGAVLEIDGADGLASWLGRLQALALVRSDPGQLSSECVQWPSFVRKVCGLRFRKPSGPLSRFLSDGPIVQRSKRHSAGRVSIACASVRLLPALPHRWEHASNHSRRIG